MDDRVRRILSLTYWIRSGLGDFSPAGRNDRFKGAFLLLRTGLGLVLGISPLRSEMTESPILPTVAWGREWSWGFLPFGSK